MPEKKLIIIAQPNPGEFRSSVCEGIKNPVNWYEHKCTV